MITAPSSAHAGVGNAGVTAIPAGQNSWRNRFPWVTLTIGLLITGAVTLQMKNNVEKIASLSFTSRCDAMQSKIIDRFDDYARLLQGGAAFFNASEKVTREQWRIFSRDQKFEKQLPGIQGIGFALLIPRKTLPRHLREIRHEGFPGYTIKPAGERELYTSIIYLEPFPGRNLRAFGYDMFSEPVRRSAMEQARDTGGAALSGKVVLVQESGVDVQPGILMYLPVYRKGMPVDTVAGRRAALRGWVYSPYRMNDLMQGILLPPASKVEEQLNLQLFDGMRPSPGRLLHGSPPPAKGMFRNDEQSTRQIQLKGQLWTLCFTQTGCSYFSAPYLSAWLTMVGGAALTILIMALSSALQNTRIRAEKIARELTADLKGSEQFITDVMDSLSSNIAVLDHQGIIVAVNESWRTFAVENGVSGDMTCDIGKQYLDCNGDDDKGAAAALQGIRSVLAGGQERFDKEYACDTPENQKWFFMQVSRLRGTRRGCVVIHTDITQQKSAARRVRESEEQLRAVFSLAAVGIARVKPTGEFMEVNDHLCTLLDYPRAELLTMTFQELTHPDDLAATVKTTMELLTGEIATFSLEKRYIRKYGAIIWGLVTVALSHGDDPSADYFVVVIEEITQRRLLEQQLAQISTEQRVILDTSSVGIAMIRLRRLGWTSAGMTRIFGYSQEELSGKATKEFFVDPLVHDRLGSEAYPLMLQGGEYKCRTLLRHHDGHAVWVHLTGRIINSEDVSLESVWIFEDITTQVTLEKAHREDEAKLRSSQTRLATIFRTSPDVIAISQRATGCFLEVNEAFERVMGYRREEALGRTSLELGTWGSPELRGRMLKELENRPRLENYETSFRRKSGELFPVLLSLEQMELDGVACLIFSARDITEQVEIKEELLQSRNVAHAANVAKSRFLANMSHEIRTPMNGVLGMAQLLAMTELSSEQQAYVETLRCSGKNLLALISDILDLSKIEAGKIELEEGAFDLLAEVKGSVSLLALQAREKGLELLTPVAPSLPNRLRGDAGRLRQILINLMGNALKFTNKGSVTLEIRKEREDKGTVTLRFLIVDTGIGISAEKLETIFAPFTQADGSTTRSHGGTGLGLTISRQLAELMGGSMGVESLPGKGSTFWFTATLKKQQSVHDSSPWEPGERVIMGTPAGKRTRSATRLLLVEDDPGNRMLMTTLLTKIGFPVDSVDNGREALIALGKNDYALVLMDCMMPLLNGYETTAAIRDPSSAVRNHLIPVIALTANAFTDDRALCRGAGMNDYLSKPVDFVQLLKMIDTWTPFDTPSTSLGDHPSTELGDHPSTSLGDHAQGAKKRREEEAESCGVTDPVFLPDDFLRRNLGDRHLACAVATIFRDGAPEHLTAVSHAVAAGNAMALHRAAHKLKGAAANLSLPELTGIARRIETIAGDGEIAKAGELLSELEQKLQRAVSVLREQLMEPKGEHQP